jgi:hypothetical protein
MTQTKVIILFALFIMFSAISSYSAFTVINQMKDDSEVISSSISIKSASSILATELNVSGYNKISELRVNLEKSFGKLTSKFEESNFGVFSSDILDFQIKLYRQFTKLNVVLLDLVKKEEDSKEFELIKNELKEYSAELKKLSNITAKKLIESNVSKIQMYFFSTQSERISKVESLLNNKFGFKEIKRRNEIISNEIDEFQSVLEQIKGDQTKIGSKLNLDLDARKILYVVEDKFGKYKKLVQQLISNESKYMKLGELYSLAEVLNEPIQGNAAQLSKMITIKAESRLISSSFVVIVVIITALLLIASLVCWYVFSQENAEIDAQRIKAEKKAFEKLVNDLSYVSKGNLTKKIEQGNIYTKDIAAPIDSTIKKISSVIKEIRVQSNATEDIAKEATIAEEKIRSIKATMEADKLNEEARLGKFQKKYDEFSLQISVVPEKLNNQQKKTSDLVNGVSHNYKLASALTTKARNISEQFKLQSENAQALLGNATAINQNLSSIESEIFNIQIQGGEISDEKLSVLLKQLIESKSMCEVTISKSNILVESSSGNQRFIEDLREDVLKLNSIAENASIQGNAIQKDSLEVMSQINEFSTIIGNLVSEIDRVVEQIGESRSKLETGLGSQGLLLESIKSVDVILKNIKNIVDEYNVG